MHSNISVCSICKISGYIYDDKPLVIFFIILLKFVQISYIVRRNARNYDEHAAIKALLSIKTNATTGGQYILEKMLMFNETLHLKEVSIRMIGVCDELHKSASYHDR